MQYQAEIFYTYIIITKKRNKAIFLSNEQKFLKKGLIFMGFLDFIEKTQEKLNAKSESFAKKLGAVQKTIETTPLETIVNNSIEKKLSEPKREPKPSRVVKEIINSFYSDYPEKPYISNERKRDWIEKASLFPNQCIIPKLTMTRYDNGLLPGHIYMLYWLKKYTNKKVPAYFEYRYGINFEKEKGFLFENGYLDSLDKPTEKGERAIKQHYSVIENHKQPKPDCSIESITKIILEQKKSFERNGFEEYEFIANSNCCEVCATLNGKHFKVKDMKPGVNAPPMHEKCRCSVAAYEDRADYDAWLEFLNKGGTTEEWEKLKRKR